MTSIGEGAFYNCSSLTSVTIGNSVTSIGSTTFFNCTGLASVTIGNSVASIGAFAFNGCNNLKKVIVPDIAAWCDISFYSSYDNPLYYAHHLYSDENTEITDLVIPNSVTSISDDAFRDCSGLISVTISNGVTSIGYAAFCGCSSLTAITIPESVTSIGDGAFSGCSGLTSITIGNGVTSIGSQAFYRTGWYNAQPNGILYLGNWLIGYKGNNPTGDLTINSGTRGIADYSFRGSSGLTSVTIPNSVTSIGNFAFCNCSDLTSITIPESVTSIGDGAFSGCSGLTSITIPNSVTSIGSYAFYNCSSLTDIYCLAEEVPETNLNAFNNVQNVTLHVPTSALSVYSTTEPWSRFGTIVALKKSEGDLNGDFKIDIADAVSVLNIMAASEFNEAADLNQDQKIDIADFVTILNIMAGQSIAENFVTSIILNETSISLQPNGTKTITATILPKDATNKNVTWSSSNTRIATVDQTGKVTAIAAGSCTITCSATDGSGVKATCEVTVGEQAGSIVGTWVYKWKRSDYEHILKLIFSGSATSGTLKLQEYDGVWDEEICTYNYTGGMSGTLKLIYNGEDYEEEEIIIIKVVSLTAQKLVLEDIPEDGNCTFYRE